MTQHSEMIVDDNGIEVLVAYDCDKTKGYYEEPGNPETFVPAMVLTELKSVEVVIGGRGIDILPHLHENEKEWIISKLLYE